MTRRLLMLNGLAAIGVATYHAAAYGFSALFEWTDRYLPVSVPNYEQIGSPPYYMLLTVRQLDAFVIPAFIFISGYFVAFTAGGRDRQLRWSVVWARVQKFLIPLLIWTAVRYILLRRFPSSIDDVLRTYYFVVLLIQFYLLSPFLVRLARTRWQILLLGALLIQGSVESLFFLNNLGVEVPGYLQQIRDMQPLWFFPMRIFWFAIGLIAGFHREAISKWLSRAKWALLVTVLILAPLTIVEYQAFARWSGQPWLGPSFRGIVSKFYALAFIFCFLAFDGGKMPFSKQMSDLGSRSLGIYLANIPVIYVVAVFMYHKTPWILGNQLLYQGLLISLGLAIPLLLMTIVSRSRYRWAYRYLFG